MEFIGIKATGYCTMQQTIDYIEGRYMGWLYGREGTAKEIAMRQALIEAREAKNK